MRVTRTMMTGAFAAIVSLCSAAGAVRVDVYPQSFEAGGWSLDAQFMDVMGSPGYIGDSPHH